MECRFIKLVNGDNIIGMIGDVDEDNDYIAIYNPRQIDAVKVIIKDQPIDTFIMKMWLPVSDADAVYIPSSKIIAITGVREKFKEQYLQYVEETEKFINGDPDISSEESFFDEVEEQDEDFEEHIESTEKQRILH